MQNHESEISILLAAEFARRKEKNSRYSLRMFAKKLALPPGRLSEFISGKRSVTGRQAEKIADRLDYSPEEKKSFLSRITPKTGRKLKGGNISADAKFHSISNDTFHVVADWYHFAILSLMETTDFQMKPHWIAARLGINERQAKSAVSRMARVGLIHRSHREWKQTHKNLTTTHDLESVALRISHRQSLEQAMEALDSVGVKSRDVTAMTMAIDPQKLTIAKKMIRQFRRRLCAILESGQRTEVFNLNIQLLPVSKTVQKRGTKS